MGDFKDAKLWMKVAFLMIMLGFTLDLFAFATELGGGTVSIGGTTYTMKSYSSIEACLIIGLISFLVAATLALCLVFLDECKDNKIVKIVFIIFAFIAGIATIIGIAIWGGKYDDAKQDPPAYATALGVLGGLLAILAGIFGILDLLGVGSG